METYYAVLSEYPFLTISFRYNVSNPAGSFLRSNRQARAIKAYQTLRTRRVQRTLISDRDVEPARHRIRDPGHTHRAQDSGLGIHVSGAKRGVLRLGPARFELTVILDGDPFPPLVLVDAR